MFPITRPESPNPGSTYTNPQLSAIVPELT